MDAAAIIDLARILTWCTTEGQLSNTDAVVFLNKAYRDFYNRIVSLDKNYFRDNWTADIVADQSEYSFKQPTTDEFGMNKPENVRIKWDELTGSEFYDVFLTDWDALTRTPERYEINQSKGEPIWIITDRRYIKIFPTPTVEVEWGLIFEWAKVPYDLDIASVESDILIDPLHVDVLAYIMMPMIYEYKTQIDLAQNAEAKAERQIQRALRQMWVLKTKAIRASVPRREELE